MSRPVSKQQEHVVIYTDGNCEPNPGTGGWGVVLLYGKHKKELSGGVSDTTNNRMELTAAIKALSALKRPCKVDLYSDSSYVIKGMTEWIHSWKRRQWRRKGQAISNLDLWQELDRLSQGHDITWHWVRGHAGNHYNERCDELAAAAIQAQRADNNGVE